MGLRGGLEGLGGAWWGLDLALETSEWGAGPSPLSLRRLAARMIRGEAECSRLKMTPAFEAQGLWGRSFS